ncbi:MAG: hypothetical protein K2M55_06960 [Muribaculaceae bacterium]|nr:hypothetical protein [Muribaculaceae bacterium]
MTKFVIRYIITLLLLIPAQAIIFNHLVLFDVAVPLVFIYLIVMLPVTIGTNVSMLVAFAAGLLLDVFCDTPGVNALCATVLSFARKPIFHLYVSTDDDLAARPPSSLSMGHTVFMKYLLSMVVAYCTMYFTVEAFQFFNFRLLVLRILASSLYTFILLYALDCISMRMHKD